MTLDQLFLSSGFRQELVPMGHVFCPDKVYLGLFVTWGQCSYSQIKKEKPTKNVGGEITIRESNWQ